MRTKRLLNIFSAALCLLLLCGCGCKHLEWSAPSCTEPASCLSCGKSEGLPLGHQWLEADCDTPESCVLCGQTKGEALGHSWLPADYENPQTCLSCGATEGDPVERTPADFRAAYEEICSALAGKLDKAEFFYDAEVCILYVSIPAKDGTAKKIVSNPEKLESYWESISEKLCTLSLEVHDAFAEAGFKVDSCIYLLSDINEDNVLLEAYNGKITYDVMA